VANGGYFFTSQLGIKNPIFANCGKRGMEVTQRHARGNIIANEIILLFSPLFK